jgi:hypothetical protein
VQQRRIDEICAGKRAITADTALRLAKLFDMDAQTWRSLQAQYDLETTDPNLANRSTGKSPRCKRQLEAQPFPSGQPAQYRVDFSKTDARCFLGDTQGNIGQWQAHPVRRGLPGEPRIVWLPQIRGPLLFFYCFGNTHLGHPVQSQVG